MRALGSIPPFRGRRFVLALALAALAVFAANGATDGGRVTLCLNPVWRFHLGDPPGSPSAPEFNDTNWDIASLPHSHQLFSANLAGFEEQGRNVGWYRREIQAPPEWLDRKVFLEFQGAMQTTTVWLNGTKIGEYAVSGYDSFHFDLTPAMKAGKNLLAVRVDNTLNPNIPPDGKPADYILFGGLYRDVFLHVTDKLHLTFPWEDRQAGVQIVLPAISRDLAVIQVESTVRNESTSPRTCTPATPPGHARLPRRIRGPGLRTSESAASGESRIRAGPPPLGAGERRLPPARQRRPGRLVHVRLQHVSQPERTRRRLARHFRPLSAAEIQLLVASLRVNHGPHGLHRPRQQSRGGRVKQLRAGSPLAGHGNRLRRALNPAAGILVHRNPSRSPSIIRPSSSPSSPPRSA